MTEQPLSEKRIPIYRDYDSNDVVRDDFKAEDVKQAIQKTLKELKERLEKYCPFGSATFDVENSAPLLSPKAVITTIDTTFKQNFGSLVE